MGLPLGSGTIAYDFAPVIDRPGHTVIDISHVRPLVPKQCAQVLHLLVTIQEGMAVVRTAARCPRPANDLTSVIDSECLTVQARTAPQEGAQVAHDAFGIEEGMGVILRRTGVADHLAFVVDRAGLTMVAAW